VPNPASGEPPSCRASLQHICLEVSSDPEDLDYLVQVYLIGTGAKTLMVGGPPGAALDTP